MNQHLLKHLEEIAETMTKGESTRRLNVDDAISDAIEEITSLRNQLESEKLSHAAQEKEIGRLEWIISLHDLAAFYQSAVADFLHSSEQLLTNKAICAESEKLCRNAALEEAAAVCVALVSDDVPCGLGGKEIAIVIRAMKGDGYGEDNPNTTDWSKPLLTKVEVL